MVEVDLVEARVHEAKVDLSKNIPTGVDGVIGYLDTHPKNYQGIYDVVLAYAKKNAGTDCAHDIALDSLKPEEWAFAIVSYAARVVDLQNHGLNPELARQLAEKSTWPQGTIGEALELMLNKI